MITEQKLTAIENALQVGMALEDALILASLPPKDIATIMEDEELQMKFSSIRRKHEYGLLTQLHEVMDVQVRMGKEAAITWMLERVNPRWSGKPQNEQQSIHLHFASEDPSDYDTVTVFNPEDDAL